MRHVDEKHYVNSRCATHLWSVHKEGGLFCGLREREKRILLILSYPTCISDCEVMAALLHNLCSLLLGAIAKCTEHHLSLPSSCDTSCNIVRTLMVLYASPELSFQALKIDTLKESFQLLHGQKATQEPRQSHYLCLASSQLEGLPSFGGRRHRSSASP